MSGQDQRQSRPSEGTLEKFNSLGFASPTEIQKKAIPIISQKKDSLVIAPTGSGKTECAVIPIFSHIRNHAGDGRIKVLYITPLRALNRDVFRRISTYAKMDNLTVEIRHGDTPQRVRRKISLEPPDILVTTPETLVAVLTQPRMLEALCELEWIVIDEVHELLSSERGSQLSLSLERLALNSIHDLTRIGLSATIGNKLEASKFVSGTKRKCHIIEDTSVRRYDVELVRVDGAITDVADYIVQYIKEAKLDSPVLLFCNSRGEAEMIASVLREHSGIPVELHHGSLSRESREETEHSLKEGKFGIIVCTSSLELGIDVDSVELVIHYGSPRQVSKLVQRIGRSRHNRDSSARGLVVVDGDDDEYEMKAILERLAEGSIEDQRIHEGSLDVLAHHLVGLTIQIGTVSVESALDMVRRAYPFSKVTITDMMGVLDLLDSRYLLIFEREKLEFSRKKGSFMYYYENLSTIPDILRFRVFDSASKKIVGTLDQRFVGDHGEQGSVFVLRGSRWRILSVDEKALRVSVEPYHEGAVTVPYWEGEKIPVDHNTARRAGRFRSRQKLTHNMIKKEIAQMDIPNERAITIESSKVYGALVLHACFGTRINQTISALLSSMISSITGSPIEARSDAYRIALASSARISEKILRGVLNDSYDLSVIIAASLDGTHNANWRTWCVSKKFGVVGKKSVYESRLTRYLYMKYSKTPIVKEALRELFHDKYDLDATQDILDQIKDGTMEVRWNNVSEFSKLAMPVLDHLSSYRPSGSALDSRTLETVKKRLYGTVHRLVCVRCGNWERAYKVSEAPASPSCPRCKARQIAATFYSDYDLPDIVRKKSAGRKLSESESHKFGRAWKTASLVESFGRDALLVLAGYGVGADTAARILRNMVDADGLVRQIHEAERHYTMTRMFWD